MFANGNSLPLPSNFDRPLRLTGEAARPQPTGQCHFVLLHPSVHNQRCSCQMFRHNRSAPGDICDCGHQACYHLPDSSSQRPYEPMSLNLEHVLLERIKRLEQTIQNEREVRDNMMQRERQAWERELRIFREALAPFYKSEQGMRRKLIELEDRVEGNYDEQVRLKERVVAIDDTNMTIEKRVEELEGSRGKRRRISRQHYREDSMPNGYPVDDVRRMSSNPDERSVQSSSSRALSPSSNIHTVPEADGPRSSGILNLMDMPRSTPHAAPIRKHLQHVSPDQAASLPLTLLNEQPTGCRPRALPRITSSHQFITLCQDIPILHPMPDLILTPRLNVEVPSSLVRSNTA